MQSANIITFEKLATRLDLRSKLGGGDHEAIAHLDYMPEDIKAGGYLVRHGEKQTRCPLILEGYAYRQKLTDTGTRQIVAIQMPGDFVDLQTLFLEQADHSVQALTDMRVAQVSMESMRRLVLDRPTIARSLWIEALIEASIYREWITNIGRRDARKRVAHFLCEFGIRAADLGMSARDNFTLPMTQEEIADATGLTPIHVNRVLRTLGDDGLITRERRHIEIDSWDRLRQASDFDESYLHLPEKRRRFTV